MPTPPETPQIGADVNTAETADILLGAKAIGDFLGFGERRTERLIRLDAIPTFRIGGRSAATRDGLRSWIAGNAARARAEHEARRGALSDPRAP